MTKRLTAEFIGTLWPVLGGCGSAVLAVAPIVGAAPGGVVFRWGASAHNAAR